MPILPAKLQQGQLFKQSAVKKINEIIDYLKSQRIISDNKTIRINQLTNGVALTALSQQSSKGSSVHVDTDHPFKLKIGTLQNETSGNSTPTPILKISQARIIVSGDEASRIYFCYDDNNIGLPTYLNLPETDGEYNVVGYAVYDYNAPQNSMNMLGWGTGCIYADYIEGNTSEFTESCGFFTFVIGSIKVETDDDGNKKYSITRQLLYSSLDVHDCNVNRDFRGHWQKNTYPTDGQIVEDLIADKFIINKGSVLSDGIDYYLTEYEQSGTPSEQNLYCVKFNTDGSICEYAKVSLDDWIYFNEQQSVYLIPICTTYQSGSSAVGLIQFVEGSLIFNIKGKIALNEMDQVPSEYLQDKLKYQTKERNTLEEQQKKIYGQNKTYIIGITTDANEQSEIEPKVRNLYDDLYWDWTSIREFDKKKHQVIMQQKGDLKWAPVSSNVPEIYGSLTSILEIKEQKNDDGEVVPFIRYKPQYEEQFPADDKFYFIVQNHQRKITQWTWYQEEIGEGAFVWNYEQKQPLVHIPPEATDEVSAWVLTGAKQKNMQWMPYTNDANPLRLSGSIQNVFELVDEVSGKTLRVLTEYDDSIEQYHFINLDSEGKLQATTFIGEGLDSLMLWNNKEDSIGPTIYDCPDAEQNKLFFLIGDKDNGILWQNLYDYCQTVKVTESDSKGDYLFNKIQSTDESIMVVVDEAEECQMLDLTVNPEWFISSDESVIIEYTQDGFLDFTGAGMVQVTEEDQPGFLIDKLSSSLEHITIDVNVDQIGMFADLNLNPETFISSDESIIIEATEDGYIDFIGTGQILCSKNDQVNNYLEKKLCSEKQSILFNIVETHPENVQEDLKHQAINLQVNPQFLKDNLKIDQSLKDVLTIEMQEETGILNIKPVFPQNIEDCVLGRKDGKIQWIPLGTCQESQNE